MKAFKLYREHDISGVSGAGIVLEGVVFSTGKCIVNWKTPAPSGSVNVFDTFEQFKAVHIDSHPENNSKLIWYSLTGGI